MSNFLKASSILGIDIGGTGIKAALVNPEHRNIVTGPRKLVTLRTVTAELILSVIHELIKSVRSVFKIECNQTEVKNE